MRPVEDRSGQRVERFLTDSARRHPHKVAVVAGTERISYGALDEASDRIAGALVSNGVARGDRIAVFMENCWQAVASIFAVLKAGAVFSPVNPSTKAGKLAHILSNSAARAVMTQAKLMAVAGVAAAEVPSVSFAMASGLGSDDRSGRVVRLEDVIERPAPLLPHPGIDLDLAMLIYTSGSTGTPKGVMMTHQNVVAASTAVMSYLENTADDVILSVLPMSFSYGLYQVLTAVAAGATIVLEPSIAYPHLTLRRMAEERATGFPIVPTIAALIAQMRDLAPGALPHLRYITNAAAALPTAHVARLREIFPGARLYSMYGQTECKRGAWLPPDEIDRRPDSVGIPVPGTETWIVDEAGRRVPTGVTGELVIRGAHVMQGYWGDPEETARALRPGPVPGERVLHTGDLFRADGDGFLYFVGRKDDIINTRGEKVSPLEVERTLYALPFVREAAVVGVPDPVLGMALHAVLAVDDAPAMAREAVIRHCAAHLEDFMVPRSVEFRDTLPKTASGKICRRTIAIQSQEAA